MRMAAIILTLSLVLTATGGCLESGGGGGGRPPVGAYNKDYLRGRPYDALFIEIDYVKGFPPSEEAIDHLRDRIGGYCEKGSITVDWKAFDSDDDRYTLEEIVELEREHRTSWRHDGTIVLYVLYLNGEYSGNRNALGLAYYADAFVVFKERIEDVATTRLDNPFLVSSNDIEKSVLVHEFGHLLGLVNINYRSGRDHEDPEHENHCIHEDCVMNAQIETTAIANLINTGGTSNKPPTDFCADCQADLHTIAGG